MNGHLTLPLTKKKYYTVYGGPYRARPANMRGVKMAAEIEMPSDVSVPTRDFSVPGVETMKRGLIDTANLVLAGQPVYVGCMGGVGRTGLMLALLAKAFGVDFPVAYVREHYYPHAVETAQQMKYVSDFQIPKELVWRIKVERFFSYFRFGSPSLTLGA